MREENVFVKLNIAAAHDRIQRDTAQIPENAALLSVECEWNQSRTSFNDSEAKLPRDTVAEIRCADSWYRQSAGCDHERTAFEVAQVRRY